MIEGWGLAAAGIAAAGTIGGAVISGNAAKGAAQDQENAAMSAEQAQMSMFNTTQSNEAGQIALGKQSSTLLSNLLGPNGNPNYSSFDNSPGYKFAVQQGQAGIQKQAAASGGLYSSATLGAMDNYNSGMASTQYNNYVQQLMQGAGLGNAAGSTVGAAGTATGQGIAGSMNLAGSAAAAGTLGEANAFTNALGSNSLGQFGNSVGGGVGNLMSGLNWDGGFTTSSAFSGANGLDASGLGVP